MKKTSVQKALGFVVVLAFALSTLTLCPSSAGAAGEDQGVFTQYLPSTSSGVA